MIFQSFSPFLNKLESWNNYWYNSFRVQYCSEIASSGNAFLWKCMKMIKLQKVLALHRFLDLKKKNALRKSHFSGTLAGPLLKVFVFKGSPLTAADLAPV